MVTKAQKVRVIVFISIVSMIFLYILFLLVGQKLFTSEDTYFIKLKNQSVTGLNVGQDVRYYGINIGKITDIEINKSDISEIILSISVKSGTPLKNTVKANLNFLGITGLKVIELTGGENSDKDLQPGSFIEADRGILDNITGKAEIITEKVEKVLNNILDITGSENRGSFKNIVVKIDSTVNHLDILMLHASKLVVNNRSKVSDLIENTNRLVVSLDETSKSIRMLANSGNRILNSKESAKILNNITELSNKLNSPQTDEIIKNLNGLISEGNNLIGHLDKTFMSNRKNIIKSIELLKETLDNFNEFVVLLRENPDILIKGKQNE